jgi:uncharacterized protein
MKVVLDANIFVSALIAKKGPSDKIVHHSLPYVLVTSEEILQEVERVLHYEHIQKRYKPSNQVIGIYLHQLRRDCLMNTPPAVKVVEKDPTDNKYFACAKQAKAEYVISRDPHLLDIREYKGIRVVTPAQFLQILKEQYPSQLN